MSHFYNTNLVLLGIIITSTMKGTENNMIKPNVFEKAQKFIYRNARPLDLARWKFHFENGSADEVVNILSMYQNNDGGFAYAIEPDNWNINSTPISTWTATMILNEIGFTDSSHSVIKGILEYLDSGKDFADGKWFNTAASNNDYPHAVWWECNDDIGCPDDNPTVSLAGFALKFSDKDSSLYSKASEIAVKAYNDFITNPIEEFHTLRCFADMLGYCETIENFNLFDLNSFRDKLILKINEIICNEPDKWFTDYVCKPSVFYMKNNKIFDFVDRNLAEKEADIILTKQLPDGSFPVTWQWYNDYKEFEISANWWKSDIIIKNMLYLREFSKIN